MIPLVCWLAARGTPTSGLIAAAVFGLAAVTDWLDGYIARKRGLVSLTGKFLDPLADKLLVLAVLITLIPEGRMPAWLVILLVSREVAVTALRALAAGEGLIIAAGSGGKMKAAFQFVAIVLLLIQHRYLLEFGLFTLDVRFHHVGMALLIVSLGYSLYSGGEYTAGFLKAIDRQDEAHA